jgi:transposase
MRFVPVKTEEQQSALTMHRASELLVRQWTQLINAVHRHSAKSGLVGAVNAERTLLKSAEVNFPTRRASVIRCWREQGLWAWADGRGGGAAVRAAAA